MPRPRCYVASPLGFTEAGRYYYYREYLPALSSVVDPVDPWALTTEAEIEAAAEAGRAEEFAFEIGRRNASAIQSSVMVVALLDGQEPDAGTVAEVGYGAGLGLFCFGLRSDSRQSGEPGVLVNLQLESFIVMTGGRIVSTLAELLGLLKDRSPAALELEKSRGE